jgi:hypothetical protein
MKPKRQGTIASSHGLVPTCRLSSGNITDEMHVFRYLPAYRIEGPKKDKHTDFLLKLVSNDVDWPDNQNRVHGKCYRRTNGRH